MRVQADEEHAHAMKIYEYIHDRMGRVTLAAIAAPPTTWASPLAVFKEAARHEAKVTGVIHALADQAAAEKDHATGMFLQWFISEQVEEEATAGDILSQLQALKDAPGPLLMLDRALAQRGKS